MDDDLRALLGDDFDDERDDDLFVEFDAADDDFFSDDLFADEPSAPAEPEESAPVEDDWRPPEPAPAETRDDDVPSWLSDAPDSTSPAPVAGFTERSREADAQPVSEMKKRKRSNFLGMTPFQRMVLAIFFFLDVLVIGFLLLVALGRITF